ncbi:MAG TPA: STAS domain-containing protein [Bryobacteraceae bacterium]|nr:STAS domain-containing protein [Bryobacteraceae bacterium]
MNQATDPVSLPDPDAANSALDNLRAATAAGLAVERSESGWLVRVEGDLGVAQAAELHCLLLEGLASGKPLRLDLARAGRIDITILQLIWAAGREAGNGSALVCGLSDLAASVARDAGFASFPGALE